MIDLYNNNLEQWDDKKTWRCLGSVILLWASMRRVAGMKSAGSMVLGNLRCYVPAAAEAVPGNWGAEGK